MVEKHNLTFPVIYGLDVQKEADKIGGYFDSEHGYFQPANFILRDSKVFNATYSSGPLGRLQAQLVLEVVSKIPQHDFDASESDHTQEIVDVVLVAGNQAAKHLQPSEQTLDCPAPPIAA